MITDYIEESKNIFYMTIKSCNICFITVNERKVAEPARIAAKRYIVA